MGGICVKIECDAFVRFSHWRFGVSLWGGASFFRVTRNGLQASTAISLIRYFRVDHDIRLDRLMLVPAELLPRCTASTFPFAASEIFSFWTEKWWI
jgi:hypothetical protein